MIGWLGRGTLHMVRREDYRWLLALTAPFQLTGTRRRLMQEGVGADAAERAVGVFERALGSDGPLTRDELAERLTAAGIRSEGQAMIHLLSLAAQRGVVVRGPVRSRARQAWALARDWLGEDLATRLEGEARDLALRELARRYLVAHGPASDADLATWAGINLGDARAGLTAIASELVERPDGLVELAGRTGRPSTRARRLPPRLLGVFDPYLLGWKRRGFMLPSGNAHRVVPGGGLIRPVAIVDGLAAATWAARRSGTEIAISIDPLGPLSEEAAAALRVEAVDIARFEGRELR